MEVLTINGMVDKLSESPTIVQEDYMNEIRNLVTNIGMIEKKQLFQYYEKQLNQEKVSYYVNRLEKEGQIFALPDSDMYVPDERMADPAYFQTRDAYSSTERFNAYQTSLKRKNAAFWVFLEFKKAGDARDPVSIDNPQFPFITMMFFMGNTVYEILYVEKGAEPQLTMLAAKERYDSTDGLHRIVAMEDPSQISEIEKYKIAGIQCYAVYKDEHVTYYNP